MINTIKKFFEGKSSNKMNELLAGGAVVLDVRSKSEFAGGHAPNAINMPLPQLQKGELKLSKEKTIITCCASGMRSATAKKWLEENGYSNVINGGSWQNLA